MPRTATTIRLPRQGQELPVERMLLTVEEAAAVLGIGRSLMFELIGNGVVDTVRVGRLRRIRPDALRAYVDSLAA
ncbi:MAG: excisionase family DNA-binding protein [Sporichthyaceae bacterium]